MAKRRKRLTKSLPTLILWNRKDQLRFTMAVEQLIQLRGEMAIVLSELKNERDRFQAEMASRRSEAAKRANATRRQTIAEQVSDGPIAANGKDGEQ
jgi:hypothetical protein